MPDSIPNIKLDPGVWVDLYAQAKIAVGTPLSIFNISDSTVRIHFGEKPKPGDNSGFRTLQQKGDEIRMGDGSTGAWGFSSAGGEINVEPYIEPVPGRSFTPTVGIQFAGIYETLNDLRDAVKPQGQLQAIVIQPSEKYYHVVANQWVELAPVGSIHSNYIGSYDSIQDLQTAHPNPADDSLAIVGTADKEFYLYNGSAWDQLTHNDMPSIAAKIDELQKASDGAKSRLTVAEGHLDDLKVSTEANAKEIAKKQNALTFINGDGNQLGGVEKIKLDGAELKSNGDGTHTLSINPPAGGLPKFDSSIFQSAVSHGFATDDQGVKSSATKEGWTVFKGTNTSGSLPPGATGDTVIFKKSMDVGNPALKHFFVMAIGKDAGLNNKIWFMYRDGTNWTPWFSEQGASQATVDSLSNSVDQLKRSNQATLDEVAKLQTAIGNVYSPGSKSAFDNDVNTLIKNYMAQHGSKDHGKDLPPLVLPEINVLFDTGIPTDLSGAQSSTNGVIHVKRIAGDNARMWVVVDKSDASKVKSIKVGDDMASLWDTRDLIIGGKTYTGFYSAGGFGPLQETVTVKFE